MSLHLQRMRFSVRTKNQLWAGTDSAVHLWYTVKEEHYHPQIEPGTYSVNLDHPFHDDFQRGKIDSYEVDLAPGSSGRKLGNVVVPNGLAFRDLDHVREMEFDLEIAGSDQWIVDRYMLAGYFKEVRPIEGQADQFEIIDLGWLEMARLNGDLPLSTDPNEGEAIHRIELNGSFK